MAIGVFGLQVAYKLKRLEVMSTQNTHGWFGGGLVGSPTATVKRIDFSNDTSSVSPRGPLSTARTTLAATGNSNYGWFGGGGAPGFVVHSAVDRIDFSNDSATASPRGPLSLARGRLAATGNSNYGWFGGGAYPPSTPAIIYSTVDRIDFSNDNATASPRGPLFQARNYLTATGNSNYGWFGGGYLPAPALPVSTVDRIDFSNDSTSASPRGPLGTGARHRFAATGNSNYGWFGAGISPGVGSTVDRIDFSNDTGTALTRGPLSAIKYKHAATGNSNYGWFGGGTNPSGSVTIVDRIDF